jgi:hypothetical protein
MRKNKRKNIKKECRKNYRKNEINNRISSKESPYPIYKKNRNEKRYALHNPKRTVKKHKYYI